jgi:hypothetical protein
VRQHCTPASALLHETTSNQLADMTVRLCDSLTRKRCQTWELCLVSRHLLTFKGVNERASLGRMKQLVIRIVPLPEEPLKDFVVRQTRARPRALDRFCQSDGDPSVATGHVGNRKCVDL